MAQRAKSSLSEILTVEEIAIYLKVTERSIYGLLSKHAIPAFKVGGSWRFRHSEIEEWIKSNSLNETKKAKK